MVDRQRDNQTDSETRQTRQKRAGFAILGLLHGLAQVAYGTESLFDNFVAYLAAPGLFIQFISLQCNGLYYCSPFFFPFLYQTRSPSYPLVSESWIEPQGNRLESVARVLRRLWSLEGRAFW